MVSIKDERTRGEKIDILATGSGLRLDLFVSEHTDLNRTRVQKLIKEGRIVVNNLPVKANYKVNAGDQVLVEIPPAVQMAVLAEDIALDIVYEDDDLIVINKPQGLVVHPAVGNYTGTLVNALLKHCIESLSGINGVMRPGIVHRIDKDTSGLLVVAKNDRAHLSLAEQIKNKSVAREYLALVHGVISEPGGVIDAPIGRHPVFRKKMAVHEKGRPAKTHYQVLERFQEYSLVKAKLDTGRTHQIRVHLAFIGHPVAGDPVYGPKKPHFNLSGQLLHAHLLGFIHPGSSSYLEFQATLPVYFQQVMSQLRNKVK